VVHSGMQPQYCRMYLWLTQLHWGNGQFINFSHVFLHVIANAVSHHTLLILHAPITRSRHT